MAPKIQVKKSAIDKAKSVLAEVAPKEKEVFELREAIAELRQEIEGILVKGYSFDEAAELLSNSGVEIKGSSLKQYLTMFRRQDAKKKANKMRTGKVGQGTKPDLRSSTVSDQVVAKTEPQVVVEELDDGSGIVKNSKKSTGRKSSEFVEVAEDL